MEYLDNNLVGGVPGAILYRTVGILVKITCKLLKKM